MSEPRRPFPRPAPLGAPRRQRIHLTLELSPGLTWLLIGLLFILAIALVQR